MGISQSIAENVSLSPNEQRLIERINEFIGMCVEYENYGINSEKDCTEVNSPKSFSEGNNSINKNSQNKMLFPEQPDETDSVVDQKKLERDNEIPIKICLDLGSSDSIAQPRPSILVPELSNGASEGWISPRPTASSMKTLVLESSSERIPPPLVTCSTSDSPSAEDLKLFLEQVEQRENASIWGILSDAFNIKIKGTLLERIYFFFKKQYVSSSVLDEDYFDEDIEFPISSTGPVDITARYRSCYYFHSYENEELQRVKRRIFKEYRNKRFKKMSKIFGISTFISSAYTVEKTLKLESQKNFRTHWLTRLSKVVCKRSFGSCFFRKRTIE